MIFELLGSIALDVAVEQRNEFFTSRMIHNTGLSLGIMVFSGREMAGRVWKSGPVRTVATV